MTFPPPLISARVHRHVVSAEFDIPADTGITVLFGPSGSGKTTVLRSLAGLEPLDAGAISFRGREWNDGPTIVVPARQRRVGLLFQDHALFPHMGVESNVAYGLGRATRTERQTRVTEALAAAHALHLRGRRVRELSGGEAQRVALARALAPQPDLLLLDEPLSSLDAATRNALRVELRQILTEQGIPSVIVTHDRSEALALADQIILLVDGRVRQSGRPQEVFDRPTDPSVAAVVGVETTHAATIESANDGATVLSLDGTHIRSLTEPGAGVAVGASVLACIRAEDVSVQLERTDAISSQRNQLPAVIASLSVDGPLVRVDMDAGFPLASYITRPALEDLDLKPGSAVVAVFKAQAVHVIPRGGGSSSPTAS